MRILRLNFFCLGLTLLTACGGGNHTTAQDVRGLPYPERNDITGPLGDSLKKVQDSKFRSDCDAKSDATKRKMVNLVNDLADRFSDQTSSTNADLPTLPFNGSFLLNYPKAAPSPGAGWDHYRYGWNDLNDLYEKHKDNVTAKLWIYLNSNVRSLLLEDLRRVYYGMNYSINHLNVPALAPILKTIDRCYDSSVCLSPDFTPTLLVSVKGIDFYRYFMEAITEAQDPGDKRKLILSFGKRVAEDADFRLAKFNPELKVKRDDQGSHLELPLDATHFSDTDQALIKTIIESNWKSAQADLKVNIISKASNSNVFEVLFHTDSPGQRPFVSPSEKTLNLFPSSRVRSIAHEFGHVIGLSDHYYTTWDESKCQYDQESNPMDIMSDSSSGDVMPEDWKAILDHLDTQQS